MSDIIKEFIDEARGVSIEETAKRLKLDFKPSGSEHPQPCPLTGGTDRFSFNTAKNSWVCRHCGVGGRDGIGMAAHCQDLDLKVQADLIAACEAVLGKAAPDEAEQESDEDKAARMARIAARRKRADDEAQARAAGQADFREKERRKARGIYGGGATLYSSALPYGRFYLEKRGSGVPGDRWLRVSAEVTYWHGQDWRGDPVSLHVGPAMVAPFIFPDLGLIGCHITWIDLARPPKFRPLLTDPDTGEILPTKKMRGSKKGGLIPLAGQPSARRWLGGEGIENGLAFARWEGFRADTFYFAAGDLGNLSGPADPASRFPHPTLKKAGRNGVERPVMVPGVVPRAGQSPDDAMWVADHVDELVLLADGDSEPVMTAAAMVRARTRHQRPEGQRPRLIPVVWPGRAGSGMDFAAMMANHDSAFT